MKRNPTGFRALLITGIFVASAALGQNIQSLSPSSIAAGGPSFTLTVNGSGFTTSLLNSSAVLWNGSPLLTSYINSSQLVATVPANLIAFAGGASITVVNPGGSTSNALTFTITAPAALSLSSLSPTSATPGGPAFTLTANGTGFLSGAVVQWNGAALSTSYVSANQLSAFVPANLIATTGTASVTVVNPSGATSNALTFTITTAATPVLNSLSPSAASAGGAAFTLTVNGSGFQNGATVLWNGSALSTSTFSANQVSAFVTANLLATSGTASVVVVNPGGAASNALTFTINPVNAQPPVLTTLSPSSITAGTSGFTLTVIGSGFVVGAAVEWNNSPLSTSFISANQLNAVVPAGLIVGPGAAGVTVLNPNGALSNSITFTINPAAPQGPVLFSLSPTSTAAGGPGFTLTVNGAGFVSGAVVQWNGTTISTNTSGNTTQITAVVPAQLIASPGTASITVVNPNGGVSNALPFSIFSFTSVLRVAQVADGSNWKTLFQVMNLDQVPVSYTFRFWDDNGNALQLPLGNGAVGAFSGTLAVGGTAFVETPGTSPTLLEGWAEAMASGRIGVLTIFRQIVPGRPDSEGTVIGSAPAGRVFVPFDNTNGYVTGVAVANTNPAQQLYITLLFQLENGTQVNGFLSLQPRAHTAFQLTSMFPQLAGARGSMELSATTPDISVVGLRFSPSNSFTSLGAFQ